MKFDTTFYDHEETARYYKKRLKHIRTFYNKNREFYRYLKSCKTHLDHQYFIRNNHPVSCDPDVDHQFSTGYDKKLTLILAYDLFKDYLKDRINKASDSDTSKFRWTASKTDLVELIYALHTHKCINYGNVNVKELFVALEKLFNVDLGDYYRTWLDIRIRKTGRTKFLDTLKDSLSRRMEEFDKTFS